MLAHKCFRGSYLILSPISAKHLQTLSDKGNDLQEGKRERRVALQQIQQRQPMRTIITPTTTMQIMQHSWTAPNVSSVFFHSGALICATKRNWNAGKAFNGMVDANLLVVALCKGLLHIAELWREGLTCSGGNVEWSAMKRETHENALQPRCSIIASSFRNDEFKIEPSKYCDRIELLLLTIILTSFC